MAHSLGVNLNLILSIAPTRKAAAEYLGISTRSLRRWLNEGKFPSDKSKKIINKKAAAIRGEATKRLKRASQPVVKNLDYPPIINKKARKDGGYDIFYDVAHMPRDEIAKVLLSLTERRNAIYIRYTVFNNTLKYGQHAIKGPIAISEYDEDSIDDLIDQIESDYVTSEFATGEPNHITQIRVTDYLVTRNENRKEGSASKAPRKSTKRKVGKTKRKSKGK